MDIQGKAGAADYGSDDAAMRDYFRAGEEKAHALGNRGPIRFLDDGGLHPDILDAYWRCGFYIFVGAGAGVHR